jgi:hypothetical protein
LSSQARLRLLQLLFLDVYDLNYEVRSLELVITYFLHVVGGTAVIW